LDFEGKAIDAVWINGESTDPLFQNFRVVLPHSKLRTDQKNIVRVEFTNLYSKDGNGLQGYTDNENKQYLYTQSEPFYGNKVVPLFDQPDLKATFELFAVGPNDWNIVTGEVQKESLTFSEFLAKEYPQEDSAHEIIELFKNAYKDVDAGFKFFRFATT